jgi:streptogramin lyase
VADTGNHRIQKFSNSGALWTSWGSQGSSDGQFNEPSAVSVDTSGNVYVADRNNHRIQKFTANGVWVKTVGGPTSGTGNAQFYAPEGLQTDSSGNVYVADSGNRRIQKFSSALVWLTSWGSQGSSVGQFDTPQGVAIDRNGDVYVVEWGHHRVQVFHPMTYTRPIATIVQATLRSIDRGWPVELHGRGADSDTTSAIATFEWTLDESTTPFASSPNITLNTAALSRGAHTITFRVRDAQGEYSDTRSISIIVSSFGSPPTTWTFLLYLDGDNAGTAPFLNRETPLGVLYRLEQATNPNVRVVALYDGPGTNNSFYYVQQSDGHFTQEARGEVNMGDPQTLIDFVRWGKRQAPGTFTYLAIADHANGLTGIAWDTTNGNDYLSATDLRQALTAITDNGADPLDVLHLDGCLMGLLEIAYQVRGQARYLIASENLAWSAFAYERYREAVTSTTYGITLTIAVVDDYAARVGAYGLPYTIAALDMSKIDTIVTRTDTLASELLRYALSSTTNRNALMNLRAQTQAFDSTGDGQITAEDEYVDLNHWATLAQTGINDSAVKNAALALHSDLTGFIVRERHQTGGYNGQVVNLEQAHGVAIYYPRQLSSTTYQFYGQGGLTFPVDTHWDEYLAATLAALPLGSGKQPGPVEPPPLRSKIYLPFVRRAG